MVLVTGAAGFVGRRTVRALRQRGWQVRGLLRSHRNAAMVVKAGAEVAIGDVTVPASLEAALKSVTHVVHLVAIIRERGGRTFDAVNREGTRNLVEAARRCGARRLVHLSAIGAQDNPRFPYLRSKWQGEQVVSQGEIPSTILKPSIQFGAGDEFFNSLAATVKALPVTPIIGDGKVEFQPVAVDEVAEVAANALEDDSIVGEVLELGGPERMTYNQLMDVVCEHLNVHRPRVHIPPALLRPFIAIGERMLRQPPITRPMLDMVAIDNVTEANAMPHLLGRTPLPIAEGIGYIRDISFAQALRLLLGFTPASIRDH